MQDRLRKATLLSHSTELGKRPLQQHSPRATGLHSQSTALILSDSQEARSRPLFPFTEARLHKQNPSTFSRAHKL